MGLLLAAGVDFLPIENEGNLLVMAWGIVG